MPSGAVMTERVTIPVPQPLSDQEIARLLPLVRLLHQLAGVSYFKAELTDELAFDEAPPSAAQAALLDAFYSEGLGEFAYENDLPDLPRPQIAGAPSEPIARSDDDSSASSLVAIGGGKDSVVALRIAESTGQEIALFSVGEPVPIARTAEVAGLPWLRATRQIDPALFDLNAAGALNGHVPITAIVSTIAALTAEANGFGNVVMANERSASSGNVRAYGIDVNHQWSKSLSAERLLRAAIADTGAGVDYFSVLRGASELMVARAFAGLTEFHHAITSCNSVFRLDPELRGTSWCCDCPKCRFVFLILAPFMEPAELTAIFGENMLEQAEQYDEFARLASIGGFKPFECVGETDEALLAFRMLAAQEAWSGTAIVQRFNREVLEGAPGPADPTDTPEFRWSTDNETPEVFEVAARALLKS